MNSLLKKLLVITLAAPVFAFAQIPTSTVVATVGGEPVTLQDVLEKTNINLAVAELAGKKATKEELTKIHDDSFAEILDERVFLHQARKVGISISEADVAKNIADLAQAQNATTEVLKEKIIKQAGEQGWNLFNRDTKIELTKRALVKQEVLSKISVTQAEIDALLTTKKLGAGNAIPKSDYLEVQHIFINNTTAASQKKINAAKKRISAGESFESVGAVSESKVPATAAVIVAAKDNNVEPQIRALVTSLANGAVSDVIKAKNGFYLFKAIARKTDEFTLAKQNEYAKQVLTAQKFQTAYDTWHKNLAEDAKKNLIEIKQ